MLSERSRCICKHTLAMHQFYPPNSSRGGHCASWNRIAPCYCKVFRWGGWRAKEQIAAMRKRNA